MSESHNVLPYLLLPFSNLSVPLPEQTFEMRSKALVCPF